MDIKVLIEALVRLEVIHFEVSDLGRPSCACKYMPAKLGVNAWNWRTDLEKHIYLKQIEALIPLIGQGIAENIINCCVYCVNGDHEEDCETYFAAQIARNWKAVRGERGRNV